MFILTIIALVAVCGITLWATMSTNEKNEPNIKLTSILGIITFIIMLLFSSISTVGVGEVGIKTRFGAVVGKPLNSGIQFKMPYIDKVTKINIKIKKLEVDAASASKDLQTVSSKIAINYSIILEQANELFKTVGTNYENIIIAPAVQESVKSVTALYTAEELITKRSEVSLKMQETLNNKINVRGLMISSFNIINFDFSTAFNAAIEAKQVAQQNVLKAQQELEQARVDAEKKVAQAQAEADSEVAKAKAEAEALRLQKQEITDELLRLREIEVQMEIAKKWSGQLPTYMTGENGISLFEITK